MEADLAADAGAPPLSNPFTIKQSPCSVIIQAGRLLSARVVGGKARSRFGCVGASDDEDSDEDDSDYENDGYADECSTGGQRLFDSADDEVAEDGEGHGHAGGEDDSDEAADGSSGSHARVRVESRDADDADNAMYVLPLHRGRKGAVSRFSYLMLLVARCGLWHPTVLCVHDVACVACVTWRACVRVCVRV